ncbi:MAG: hypothetical protein V4692_15930, partial [Bdellovibrionota bacterium]
MINKSLFGLTLIPFLLLGCASQSPFQKHMAAVYKQQDLARRFQMTRYQRPYFTTDLQPDGSFTLVFLDKNGEKETHRIVGAVDPDPSTRAAFAKVDNTPLTPVDETTGNTFLVHHKTPDGKYVNQFYNMKGEPLTPPIPTVLSVNAGFEYDGNTRKKVYFVHIGKDEKDLQFWPLNEFGVPEKLPLDIASVRPVVSKMGPAEAALPNDSLSTWIVKRQVGDDFKYTLIYFLSDLTQNKPNPIPEFSYLAAGEDLDHGLDPVSLNVRP